MSYKTAKVIKIIFGIIFAIAFSVAVFLVYTKFLNPGLDPRGLLQDFFGI